MFLTVHAEPSQASQPSLLVVVYVQNSRCPPSSPWGSLQLLTVILTSVKSLDIAGEAVAFLASLERGSDFSLMGSCKELPVGCKHLIHKLLDKLMLSFAFFNQQ